VHCVVQNDGDPPLHLQQAKQASELAQSWHQLIADALGTETDSATAVRRATSRSFIGLLMDSSIIR
jgi:hypothetical protein